MKFKFLKLKRYNYPHLYSNKAGFVSVQVIGEGIRFVQSHLRALVASGHVTVMHTRYARLAVYICQIQASASQECTDVSQDVLIP